MRRARRLLLLFNALRELGLVQVAYYLMYRLQLASGWLARRTADPHEGERTPAHFLTLPTRSALEAVLGASGQAQLLAEAGEILNGSVRLFGGEARPLRLYLPQTPDGLPHWTAYERRQAPPLDQDIKFIWEPARFGWACTLGRAYFLTGEARYSEAFWLAFEAFQAANPPYHGPNWISAQEAALRIIAWTFVYHLIADSPVSTPERKRMLGKALAEHARRIPPSLAYARAQNNNHLLSEAAGLYTAGLALPDHPQASHWRAAGWDWFQRGLLGQIEPDGTYAQHSLNYHRLVLQLALWVDRLAHSAGGCFAGASRQRLEAATCWLVALVDPQSGQAPNLGPNDGANILPLSVLPFEDQRPTLYAARQAWGVGGQSQPGPHSELALWLALAGEKGIPQAELPPAALRLAHSGWVLRHPNLPAWVYLRAAHFRGRPGHADQLHLDLWWQGLNLALDAGTYLYNGDPPWDNALALTAVHNTLTIDGRSQMRRAGRFLWLQRAQASSELQEEGCVLASHNGYRRRGVRHLRQVQACQTGWQVLDRLEAAVGRTRTRPVEVRLHWLLPDLPWKLLADGVGLQLETGNGPVELRISAQTGDGQALQESLRESLSLARAGERLAGADAPPIIRGWCAPTYAQLRPALSLTLQISQPLPFALLSEWRLGAAA